MKILILLLLITISIAHASTSRQIYKDVVLGEIQATFVRDYNVSQQYFGPVQKGPTKKIVKKKELPNLKPEPNLSPTPDLSPRPKRRIKRGLIGLDDEDDENDGWLGKKGKGKKKKGLIEDNDFTPEPIKLNKRTVKGIIQPNKNITPKRNDWTSKKLRDLNKWQKTSKEETNKWYQDKAKILNRWKKANKVFKKNLPSYKKNLVNFESFGGHSLNGDRSNTLNTTVVGKNFVTIPHAFFSNVNDQGRRPTCAAFAATRALEISLAQNGTERKLSEQYFYYASKPRCQSSPCSKKGSWALNAFNKSKSSLIPDLPLEKDCPYKKQSKSGNETQVPLRNGCFQGQHKVTKFTKAQSLMAIIKQLDNGAPIVSAFKLSPNFYSNKGVVLYKDSRKSEKMNSHASGHAVLLIGYMKIPKSLNEGNICFLTANSWGTGWGKGGHACLSEKWVKNYRFPIPFLAVNSVR
ncbi:MAG: C1 family peptidase [Bacteriovoracaceae bacterium]|jgi:C1A family cysteine protease|nr:C1 family peptidase [Bacteriovoracaceae bacterium]